ncbi:MAG TPA: serine/threonine-protein kinase [Kofleriaceae bacterium]|nr:serine/threonine-protein kinase [Kofleriaceae bacterium]
MGNYTLGARLGSGATSEVYAGTHRFLGDVVAVKLLRSGLAEDESAVAGFVAEAERTRAIEHPSVVRVIDFGREAVTGQCYLIMERVDGETLSARLARGPLSESEVRRIGAALADGMQAAHDRGIVHRDLKPANVVLRDGAPIIVDFGIAKALGEDSAALTSRRVGTPPYMAPEQLVSGMITPGVDLWALGAVLFESVTGRRPYLGHDEGRCPQLVETAPRARTLVPVSAELDDLLARCLEREPGRRPASMSAIARVLRGEAPVWSDGDDTAAAGVAPVPDRRTEDLGPIAGAPPPPAAAAGGTGSRTGIGTGNGGGSVVRAGNHSTDSVDDAPTTIDAMPSPPRRRWAAIGVGAALLVAAVTVFTVASSRDGGSPARSTNGAAGTTNGAAGTTNGDNGTAATSGADPSPVSGPGSGSSARTETETETETETGSGSGSLSGSGSIPGSPTGSGSSSDVRATAPTSASRPTSTHRPPKRDSRKGDARDSRESRDIPAKPTALDPRAGREGLD